MKDALAEIKKDKDYDLYSLGPDGVEGNDDVSNWEE